MSLTSFAAMPLIFHSSAARRPIRRECHIKAPESKVTSVPPLRVPGDTFETTVRAPPDASRYRFRRPGTARSPVAPDRGTQFFSPTLADSRFPMRISFVTGVLCTNFQMAKESASIEPTIKKQKVRYLSP